MFKRLALLLALGLFSSLAGSSPVRSATLWQVGAGGGDIHDIDLLHFTIKNHELRILPGDTVNWTNRAVGAPHTISFLAGGTPPPLLAPGPGGLVIANPDAVFPTRAGSTWAGGTFANSGMLEPGQSWALTFTAPGTYEYLCLFHPSMTSRVIVEQPGTALSVTQADLDADFEPHSALHQRQAVEAARGLLTPDAASGSGGTATWHVAAGKTTPQASLEAFLPSTLQIREGDTVTWQWDGWGREPHTVTFLGGEPHPGEIFEPVFQRQGPPLIVANERFAAPSRIPAGILSTSYDGVGFLNSGLAGAGASLFSTDLPPGLAAAGTRQWWSVNFTKAGTYPYVCLLHPGMQGLIDVLPKTAWPPLDVQVAASHTEDLVTVRVNLRNRGSQAVDRVVVAAPVPDGARFVDSWMGNEFDNKGTFTGRDVIFSQADVSISPGRNLGPYVFTVRAKPGVDPHDLMSRAWVSFAQGGMAGSALSSWVAPLSPEVEVEHGP